MKRTLILKIHDTQESFKCNLCDKEFYLQWRLDKHQKVHEQSVKYCHYFNNRQICPYDENGCMFVHNVSPMCRFNENCNNTLCQFRHQKLRTEKEPSSAGDDNNCENPEELDQSKREDDTNDEDEVYPCDSCDQVFNEIEDLIDHYGETAHNN